MENWMDVVRWLGIAAGLLILFGLSIVGVLSWLLNHPD